MKKNILLLLCLSLSFLPAQSRLQAQMKPLVFIHVTVIDATGALAKPDMTVIVTGDRITELGKTGKVRIPKGAQVVDATGKVLIPGLWDMHVHWEIKEYLPLFIANGVTGMRTMRGHPVQHEWRREIERGALLGPRLSISSPIIDGPTPVSPSMVSVSNEAEARQAVIKSKYDGAEFIKVYSLLTRETFFAIADEAKKQGIPFAGHVPRSLTAAEVSDAGQKSIEHLSGFAFACSTRAAEVPADLVELRKQLAAGGNYLFLLRRLEAKHFESYDRQKAAALFARFKKNATWQVPTLTVMQGSAFLDDPNLTNDPRLKYLPPEMKAGWNPKNHRVYRNAAAADYASLKKVLSMNLQIVGELRRAGVELLAGTDVTNPYCFPGFSLHDELALFVKAGLTPLEALQTATRNPAKYLGRLDSLGTVEQGKLADLVLLDANPLADIGNTKKINAVIVNGKLITKAEIEAMLAKVEAVANRK